MNKSPEGLADRLFPVYLGGVAATIFSGMMLFTNGIRLNNCIKANPVETGACTTQRTNLTNDLEFFAAVGIPTGLATVAYAVRSKRLEQ